MKSIQSKIVLLIFLGIIVSITIIGGVGILSFKYAIDEDTVEIMNLTCSKNAQELNNVFGKIEKSVDIMSSYAIDNLDNIYILSDERELEKYTERISALGETIAKDLDGADSIYVRFNPEISSTKAGFWRVLNKENGKFESVEVTDFLKYPDDNAERVGWYYIPVRAGKAVWMKPYYNDAGIYVISYVVPMYRDGVLLGVVGMDIEFTYITEKIDEIEVYDTGYSFITDEDFVIIYSSEYSDETSVKEFSEIISSARHEIGTDADKLYDYTFEGVKKKAAFRTLQNGMCMAVTAPVSEINRKGNQLAIQIVIVELILIAVFIFIAWKNAKNLVKPLKELDKAAKEIANGNLDVSLECKSKDEIGTLSESLRETASQLKKRIDYINSLAFIDKLTGTKNNTAYLHEVSHTKAECAAGREFMVAVIDVNGLKAINDKYGHECGNKLIVEVANAVKEVFGSENVYRIGGDEFAVILKNKERGEYDQYERSFKSRLDGSHGELVLSAAIGSAVYDEGIDDSFESVYADFMLLENDQETKKSFQFAIKEYFAADALYGTGFFFNCNMTYDESTYSIENYGTRQAAFKSLPVTLLRCI